MADTLTLMALATHANVATVQAGVTPQLAGYRGGGVPLAAQKKGTAEDVSDYSTLRASLLVTALANRHGAHAEEGIPCASTLYVAIEHAPTANGPWELLHQFEPQRSPGLQRAVLPPSHEFVRSSYYFARPQPEDTVREQVAITWSLTLSATPEAA